MVCILTRLCVHSYRFTLAFTFGNLLQRDLDAFVEEWNAHPIRKNRHAPSPHGCPNDIYDMPTLYGKSDMFLWEYAFDICYTYNLPYSLSTICK